MEFFIISLLNGLIHGLLLFMVAAGLTLVFGMMGIINFAHASFYMIGAYLAFSIGRHAGFFLALLIAPLLVAGIGVLVERYLLRRVHDQGHGHQLLLTFGIAFVVEELTKMFFGNYPVNYRPPEFMRFPAFLVYGTEFPFYKCFVGIVALALFSILFALLKFTRIGVIVRAAVHRPNMVSALGHNVPAVISGVFGLGTWMAGVAGVVGGALLTTSPQMAVEMSVIVFVVVVVGGLGSLPGALLASLVIGLMSSFAVGIEISINDIRRMIGDTGVADTIGGLLSLQLSTFAGSIPVLLMLVVLLLRPAGLMGDKR